MCQFFIAGYYKFIRSGMIRNVVGIYFSPVGGTKAMTQALTRDLAARLDEFCPDHIGYQCYDLQNMDSALELDNETVVVIGMPAYIGKIPLPAVASMCEAISAEDSYAITAISYGSRTYGNALYELQHYAENQGFKVIGAGAFSVKYGVRREKESFDPKNLDLSCIGEFGQAASNKIKRLAGCDIDSLKIKPAPLEVSGRLPIHRISKVAPDAAALAESLLDRLCIIRKNSEWYL